MRALRSLIAVAGVVTLAGCVTGHGVEKARDMQPQGSGFSAELAKNYRELALFEADEREDWMDANLYADMAMRAGEGETFPPRDPREWGVPGDALPELRSARSDLMAAFEGKTRQNHPVLAARAQADYDCWIEEKEENHQPDDIARCRDGFREALTKLRAAKKEAGMDDDKDMAENEDMEAEKEPKNPLPDSPRTYTVHFRFDKTDIASGQVGGLHDASQLAQRAGEWRVHVIGHADTAGPADYNKKISRQRAEAVKEVLVEFGVATDRVQTKARGESDPAMETGDGVRNRDNRRAVVVLRKP